MTTKGLYQALNQKLQYYDQANDLSSAEASLMLKKIYMENNVSRPNAVLLLPVVLLYKAFTANPELFVPVVFV